MIYYGNSILLPHAYAPYTKKAYLKSSKKLSFLLHVLLYNLYAFVKLPWKTIFRGLWKKEKNIL
jgi:hypothetical protein